jgi:hypothetical protein
VPVCEDLGSIQFWWGRSSDRSTSLRPSVRLRPERPQGKRRFEWLFPSGGKLRMEVTVSRGASRGLGNRGRTEYQDLDGVGGILTAIESLHQAGLWVLFIGRPSGVFDGCPVWFRGGVFGWDLARGNTGIHLCFFCPGVLSELVGRVMPLVPPETGWRRPRRRDATNSHSGQCEDVPMPVSPRDGGLC